MSDRRPRHQSYVLRLWEVRTGGERSWRASLQSPGSSERHAFADPQSLFRFLQQAMEGPTEHQREARGKRQEAHHGNQ